MQIPIYEAEAKAAAPFAGLADMSAQAVSSVLVVEGGALWLIARVSTGSIPSSMTGAPWALHDLGVIDEVIVEEFRARKRQSNYGGEND